MAWNQNDARLEVSKMRRIRYFLLLVWEVALIFIFRINRIFRGYGELKDSGVSFIGPKSFLEMASQALALVKDLDFNLWREFANSYSFVFYHLPEHYFNFSSIGYMCISKEYLAFEDKGIATCLIYQFFLTKSHRRDIWKITGYGSGFAKKENDDACKMTAAWLKKHHFPRELEESFEIEL
jgi:hypothetical protein